MISFRQHLESIKENFVSKSNFADYGLLSDPKLQRLDNIELIINGYIDLLAKSGDIDKLNKMQSVLSDAGDRLNKAIYEFKSKGHAYPGGGG
jgi:hypothetical protein